MMPFPPVTALDDPSRSARSRLRMITLAWVFGAMWAWTITGAAFTQFVFALGAPTWAFGLLAALPHLAALFQVFASIYLESSGRRRLVFLVMGAAGRLLWVAIAAIPWVVPDSRFWWPTLAVIALLSWICLHISTPAWMNWMADVIPRRIRGRYFARRNRIGQVMGIIATVIVGALLDQVEQAGGGVTRGVPGGEGSDLMLRMTSVILAIAGLLGALDILCFRHVPDTMAPPQRRRIALWPLFRKPLMDPEFRPYLAFNFTLLLSMGFIGQYIWVYVLDEIKLGNQWANIVLVALPLALMIVMYGVWGRLIDRLGKRPVLVLATAGVSTGALGWLLVTPHSFWPGYLLSLGAAASWPGVEVANFNFILGLAGGRKRRGATAVDDDDIGRTAYVSVNAVVTAAGGALSGLLAGLLAWLLEGWRWTDPVLGYEMTFFTILFVGSLALRLTAAGLALRLTEPAATGVRDSTRYITAMIYSNAIQALLLPTRAVGQLSRWSYRIGQKPGRSVNEENDRR